MYSKKRVEKVRIAREVILVFRLCKEETYCADKYFDDENKLSEIEILFISGIAGLHKNRNFLLPQ